ncbi:PH domain-containing protein [Aurantivibrio infirmus]
MEFVNPPLSIDQAENLDDEPWCPVCKRYTVQLQIVTSIYAAIFILAPFVATFLFAEYSDLPVIRPALYALMVVFLIVIFLLIPRKVKHTKYLLRRLDAHLQSGLMWRRTVSVGINRIQHMEITQGPIERILGLSRLAIFTAGGNRSDLTIPGLVTEDAQRLKAQLLKLATLDDDEDDSGILSS